MTNSEKQQEEIKGLVEVVQNHLNNSETLSGFGLNSLRLSPLAGGPTHLCIGPLGQQQERDLGDPCPAGWQDVGGF